MNSEILWALPAVLAGLFLLASASAWWRVANGKMIGGERIKPSDGDLRKAASVSSLAFGLLGVAILAATWVRY